jgi:hypothetical protein
MFDRLVRRLQRHPDLLPWYAAGRLGPAEARAVEAHLAACPGCVEELAALRSVGSTLRAETGEAHPSAERLAAHVDGSAARRGWPPGEIEAHLSGCACCRADRAALERSMWTERSAEARPLEGRLHRSARRPGLVLAGALAGAAAIGASLFLLRPAPAPREEERVRAVFLPSRRGGDGGPVLHGAGPWRVRLVLPFRAPATAYRVEVVRADGSPAGVPPAAASPGGSGDLVFLLGAPAGPARYELWVRPSADPGRAPYRYPFEVYGVEDPPAGPPG